MSGAPTIIELREYEPKTIERAGFTEALAEAIWHRYRNEVSVELPSFKNGYQWGLTSQGWVGYIPLARDLHLALRPKVPIANLFHMLEHAYKLGTFLEEGLVQVGSLQELYERLAMVLAKRVLDRGRRGFYRTYLSRADRTSYVRGRMNLRRLSQAPWDSRVHCHYQEHTADVEENRILAWTLFTIARSGVCTSRSLPTVRQAFRQLRHFVSLDRVAPADCVRCLYHRLNEDYQPLHALCRFFLENLGPTYWSGDRTMLPFLVDMARLFEVFVAEWLKVRRLNGIRFRAHERVTWDEVNGLRSDIDLVLLDEATGLPAAVLDTKYKTGESPSEADIHQIVFYAQATDTHEAVLVYPEPLGRPLDTWVKDIRVRTLTFALDGDLDQAGQQFLQELLAGVAPVLAQR